MPPGGDGFYYLSVFLVVFGGKFGHFEIQLNGEILCTAYAEQTQTSASEGQAECSSITYAVEGWCLGLVFKLV